MVKRGPVCQDDARMTNPESPSPVTYRTSTGELSATVRRRTRELADLRTRVARLTRGANPPESPLQSAADELVVLATAILQDLAGAEMDAHRRVKEIRAERERADHLLTQVPVPCVVADNEGTILQANRAAALLLNVGTRHLVAQRLLHFSQDREAFLLLLETLRRDGSGAECELMIRPRERQAVSVAASVVPPAEGSSGEWLWFFAADAAARPAAARRAGRGRSVPSPWPAPPAPSSPAHS